MDKFELAVVNTLRELEIPANLKGYHYIKTAVCLIHEDPNVMLSGLTKSLYPAVAKVYNTTTSSVERGIRHAIQTYADRKKQKEIMGIGRVMTNGEFLGTLAETIRIKPEGELVKSHDGIAEQLKTMQS